MNVKPIGTLLVQATSESMLPKEKLEQLVGEPDSGIEKVKQVIHVAIHPRYCSNVGLGVMNNLNKLINNWHPQLNGILAGYGKLQLKKPTGTILNEDAYFHIDVQSEFWLFRPLTGRQLKGIVTKKSDKHVSILVHDIFNIPCLKPNNLNKEDWWGKKAKLKCPAHLTVMSTDMSQKVPQIMGDLQNIGLDGFAAQKINFDETVPSPEVQEYSDDDWDDVIKASSKKVVQKSPSKVKKIPSSNPSSGASSESDEESEPARNNPMNVQVKSVNSHLTPQSSEEDSKDSNQKKSDSSDDTSDDEEEETTKIRETKEKISSMRDLKASPTKNSNENNPAVTSSKAAAGKRKPPAKFTDEQKSAIVKEVVESLISPMELSKKYGVTPDTIRSWVKKAGYELPKPNSYKKSAAATAPSKKSESKKISSNVINSTSEKKIPDVNDILMKLQPNINNIQLPSPKKSPKKSPVKKPKLEKFSQSPTSKISIPSQENHTTAPSTSEDDDTEKNQKANELLEALKNKITKNSKKKKKSSKKEKNNDEELLLESPSNKKSKIEIPSSPMFSSQDPELDDQREKSVSKLLENSDLLNDDTLKKKKKKSKKEKHHEKTRETEDENILVNEQQLLENNDDDVCNNDTSTSSKKKKKSKKDKYETFHHENIISTPTKRKQEPEIPSTAPPSKKSKKSRLSFDTSTPINVANQFSFDKFPGKIDHAKMNDSGLDHSLDESSSKPKKKKKDKKEKKDK